MMTHPEWLGDRRECLEDAVPRCDRQLAHLCVQERKPEHLELEFGGEASRADIRGTTERKVSADACAGEKGLERLSTESARYI